jgi:hypothetical protein
VIDASQHVQQGGHEAQEGDHPEKGVQYVVHALPYPRPDETSPVVVGGGRPEPDEGTGRMPTGSVAPWARTPAT